MKTQIRKAQNWRPLVAIAALLLVLLAQPALAVDKYWVGPTANNYWANGNNWSPAGQPMAGDNAYINGDVVVLYNSTLNPLLGNVIIDNSGTLQQGGGALSAGDETIGYVGTNAWFSQGGGTNTVTNTFTLAQRPGSTGVYELYGGTLSASFEVIGSSGLGSFQQTGGINMVNKLTIGLNTGSNGFYQLKGGNLSVQNEQIGSEGTGTFTQTGGTHNVSNQLTLGQSTGSNGSYDLRGGSLSAQDEIIGYSGKGSFTQRGGTNTARNRLEIGYNPGSSVYSLISGSLSAYEEYIGTSNYGSFTQYSGTHKVNNLLVLGLFFQVAAHTVSLTAVSRLITRLSALTAPAASTKAAATIM